MISLLQGEVLQKGLDFVLVNVSGFGVKCWTTPTCLGGLHEGQTATLHTELVIRQDAIAIYGFSSPRDRDTFALLIGITGIGPKLGLAAMSVYSSDDLAMAVADKNEAALQRIPGVGKKTAQRMIMEIGDKLGKPVPGATGSAQPHTSSQEVEDALVSLGWSTQQARSALDDIEIGPDTSTTLRTALQYLGRARG
ncbi:MAG: Holliday junction branch migration protein RuvA [Actinomycetaceae bacterium]|nr:Holliday junction branch migration protein RuvA [Actinomycetaceae bacterium]